MHMCMDAHGGNYSVQSVQYAVSVCYDRGVRVCVVYGVSVVHITVFVHDLLVRHTTVHAQDTVR